MGKARRKKKNNRVNLYKRPTGKNAMETDAQVKVVEKRGDIEKRHHTERKNLKREEALLRQQMRKLNKRIPEEAKQRKKLLLKIKSLEKDLAERQKKELDKVVKENEKETEATKAKQTEDKDVEMKS